MKSQNDDTSFLSHQVRFLQQRTKWWKSSVKINGIKKRMTRRFVNPQKIDLLVGAERKRFGEKRQPLIMNTSVFAGRHSNGITHESKANSCDLS